MSTPALLSSSSSVGSSASLHSKDSQSAAEPGFDKALDPDDNTFIQEQIGDSHQDIYFKQWVNIRTDTESAKKRILVLSNFQIFTIKINLLGRSVRQKFHIVTL